MSAAALPAPGIPALYRRAARRRWRVLALLALALAATLVLDTATGPALLPLAAVAGALLGLPGDPTVGLIVWSIRLPIALMAVVVGAALGLSGVVMQTILHNPLASSYTLGVSAGAGFGAALAIVAAGFFPWPESVGVPLLAFLFASLACAAVAGIGRMRGAGAEMLVLAGIALLFLFQSLQSLLQYLAAPEALAQIVFWLFGSLLKASWGKLGLVALALAAALPLLLRDAWALTALRLGEERAAGLGVKVAPLRLRALAIVSLLTAAAVAFVGTIGFVGLVAPHIARLLLGEDQRALLPGAALCGALLLSAASVASKVVVPGAVFPVGIVTALIGIPFFLWLILSSRRGHW